MIKITKEEVKNLDVILRYKNVGPKEVENMEKFMIKFVDPNIEICGHCSAQIKHAWNRLNRWASNNSEELEAVRKGDEDKPNGICMTCGKEVSDKRRRYCNDSCKRVHKNQMK